MLVKKMNNKKLGQNTFVKKIFFLNSHHIIKDNEKYSYTSSSFLYLRLSVVR